MSSKRIWTWTGRLLALVAAVVIPACGSTGSTGGVNPNGILWNSQGAATGSTGGTTDFWKDPNTGVVSPIGISNIVVSTDDATYDGYFPSGGTGLSTTKIVYQLGNLHPLSTDTGSSSIVNRENNLEGQINSYRQTTLGNVGGGGLNGGVAVGNTTGILLSGHFRAKKSARGHCKHYAIAHGPGLPEQNFEGDSLQATTGQVNPFGTPPPGNPDGDKGRLGKIGVTAYDPAAYFAPGLGIQPTMAFSGPQYSEVQSVYTRLIQGFPADISALGWSHFAVGHWRGGPDQFYWYIVFLRDPFPAY